MSLFDEQEFWFQALEFGHTARTVAAIARSYGLNGSPYVDPVRRIGTPTEQLVIASLTVECYRAIQHSHHRPAIALMVRRIVLNSELHIDE